MEQKLYDLIKECGQNLDKTSIDEVMHFYEHGEYEMALEGLIIEMIKVCEYPEKDLSTLMDELIFYYQLHIESVFDYYFYGKYEKWKSHMNY